MLQPKNFVSEPFDYHQEIEVQIDTLTNLGNLKPGFISQVD